MSTELSPRKLPHVIDDEILAANAREIAALRRVVTQITEERDSWKEQAEQNGIQLGKAIPRAQIVSKVMRMIRNGTIPVPRELLQRNLPVQVTCNEDDIFFSSEAILVAITFSSGNSSCEVQFSLTPTPFEHGHAEKMYPDFHMGYNKQATAKKEARPKPSSRAKASAPTTP